MPIFDLDCCNCRTIFEFLQIRSDEAPICPVCGGSKTKKLISTFHYRDNPDVVKHELPEPVPPLRELIGKQKPNCEGGYRELANEQRQLKEYRRRKDKQGNTEWIPVEKSHFDMGRRT